MSYQSKYTGSQIDEAVEKVIDKETYLSLSGGTMTGELGIKQDGVGIQLGTSGNICATDTHNGGGATRTILGAGIHWATDSATEDEMTVGHPLFHLALRGSNERPTYGAGTSKANNTELALLKDIPTNTSQLTNDSGYLTSYIETDPTVPKHIKDITTDDISKWNNKSDFSGDYKDLNNLPTLADLTSDATHRTVTDAEKTAWNTNSSEIANLKADIGNINSILDSINGEVI